MRGAKKTISYLYSQHNTKTFRKLITLVTQGDPLSNSIAINLIESQSTLGALSRRWELNSILATIFIVAKVSLLNAITLVSTSLDERTSNYTSQLRGYNSTLEYTQRQRGDFGGHRFVSYLFAMPRFLFKLQNLSQVYACEGVNQKKGDKIMKLSTPSLSNPQALWQVYLGIKCIRGKKFCV